MILLSESQLDTCTTEFLFRIHLPILAKQCQGLFDAIKALACCQLSLCLPFRGVDAIRSAEITHSAIASVGSDIYNNSEQAIATCALLTICELMPRIVTDWHRILKDRIDAFASFDVHGFQLGHRGSVSWAILRLGL
jgi:hypothetical protein